MVVRILFSFLAVFNLFGFYPTWNELQDLRPVAVTFYWLCEKQYITGCVKVDVILISRSQPCKFIPVNFVSKGAKDIVCLVCMWFCLLWKLRYFLETKYVNVFRKRSFFSVCYQTVFYWVYWNILDSYLSFVKWDSLCLWTHTCTVIAPENVISVLLQACHIPLIRGAWISFRVLRKPGCEIVVWAGCDYNVLAHRSFSVAPKIPSRTVLL